MFNACDEDETYQDDVSDNDQNFDSEEDNYKINQKVDK
jgi:hypothetical protein